MAGPDFLAYATLDDCETIYRSCVETLKDGQGTIVVSISGGGESEAREVSGSANIITLMHAAMRRMSALAPYKYPPRSNRRSPNFSGGVL
jgi:hypothetical protein